MRAHTGKASRAIVIEHDHILLMHRNKFGSQYYTLPGGQWNEGETAKQALIRELKEETGLDSVQQQLVFIEKHPAPHNEQYIFIVVVAEHGAVGLMPDSEEAKLNQIESNMHQLEWVHVDSLLRIPFRTPQLQQAISRACRSGFPDKAIEL